MLRLEGRMLRLGVRMLSLILVFALRTLTCIVKPVLNGHSKIDKTKIFMTNGSLMQVESIAECSHGAVFTFDQHLAIIGLEKQLFVFLRVAVLDRF